MQSQLCRLYQVRKPRRGALIVLLAVMLVFVIAFVALAVDLGFVCAVRGDLQSAADAAALAGAGTILDGETEAVTAAQRFAQYNLNNQGVRVGATNKVEVQVGHWDPKSRQFVAGGTPLDAVEVLTKSDNSSLFFGRVGGASSFPSEARAVAAYSPRDIMLVLDVSGSMTETRNGTSKINELRDAVEYFINYIQEANGNDRIGFAYYSTRARLGTGLSLDLSTVQTAIVSKLTPGGWTNIADGMKIALNELKTNRRSQAAPLMVVMTDGAANTIQPENTFNIPEAKSRVIQQAKLAQAAGIPIFTMALDSMTSEVDVDLMAKVAEITGSESFHAIAGDVELNGNTQLKEAFRRVALNRPLRLVD